ncbi:hypothetical protein H696_05836 [Fonticula alba]|uniref:Uncharacterized protein n=1 Tax=Fonticula alba TaxID=691883 RepID=A0A058Z1B1_FONAL|nr:hypothetical protein H696_05836 [Fonticula alba]KCV67728.1 hypothetical protein H696_05836 [Fonticula alba]|eukprot:XP_009497912.1 hypothetical protein H696_05836 [Fonticula alba]
MVGNLFEGVLGRRNVQRLVGLLMLLGVIVTSAAAQAPVHDPNHLCNGLAETSHNGHCIPSLRGCLMSRVVNGQPQCTQCKNDYFLVEGVCAMSHELPLNKQAHRNQVMDKCSISHCHECNEVPGKCNHCTTFMTSNQTCADPSRTFFDGCVPVSRKAVFGCASCTGGRTLSHHRTCNIHCPVGETQCGTHCFRNEDMPEGFRCDAWLLADYMHPGHVADEVQDLPPLNCDNHGTCFSCHAECANGACTGPRKTDCTACPASTILMPFNEVTIGSRTLAVGMCTAACPSGYTKSGDTCMRCQQPNCLHCDSSNLGACTQCVPGMFVQPDGTCADHCPVGFTEMLDGTCQPCAANCGRCMRQQPEICLQCLSAHGGLLDGICYESCPAGYRLMYGACASCAENCADCSASISTCNRCMPGHTLSSNGACRPNCAAGTYFDETAKLCKPCSTNCGTCSKRPDYCTTCKGPLVVLQERGVRRCVHQDGTRYTPHPGLVLPCNIPGCVSCPHHYNLCTGCDHYLHLHTDINQCLVNCPPGQFRTATGVCQACHASCGNCVGPTAGDCVHCAFGMKLQLDASGQKGSCGTHCTKLPAARAQDVCYQCEQHCRICVVQETKLHHGQPFPSTYCQECSPGTTLVNGKCF